MVGDRLAAVPACPVVDFHLALRRRCRHDPSPDVPPPQEVQRALADTLQAEKLFCALPPSHKREYLRWIDEAMRVGLVGTATRKAMKRADTRERRIRKMMQRLSEEAGA